MKGPSPEGAGGGKPSAAAATAGLVLKILWIAFVVTTPLLGAWVASSLAAYDNGPVELAAASALLAFPVLPLLWEAWANRRHFRRKPAKPHTLTFLDRLILRTLAVNLIFLGILLGTQPATAFAALSTRGDWMLDDEHGQAAESVRQRLFWAADRLEWLYLAVHENPFDQKDDKDDGGGSPSATGSAGPTPSPSPAPTDKPSSDKPSSDKPSSDKPSSDKPSSDKPSSDKPSSDRPYASTRWPPTAGLHPIVVDMPKEAEESIATVARYISERESDEVGRFRAAHDWVADRIAYDGPSYVAGKYPPQDAESVFRRRVGVCAGYAKLLSALGRALGLDVPYVVGDARTSGSNERGDGHAWSAVKLGDRYYLVDATWNSGYLDGSKFTKSFRTDYLFTPPTVFNRNHFPDEAKWQLVDQPISRGEFFRNAMMAPRFYAEGRELISPTRSQVTVDGPFTAEMKTPNDLYTLATWSLGRDSQQNDCTVDRGEITRVTCDLPGKGSYLVRLFGGAEQYGSYKYIGQFEANRE